MDALSCKTASRCASCHHFTSGRCDLEADLELFFDAPARRRQRPAIPLTLSWQDHRAPAAAHA